MLITPLLPFVVDFCGLVVQLVVDLLWTCGNPQQIEVM